MDPRKAPPLAYELEVPTNADIEDVQRRLGPLAGVVKRDGKTFATLSDRPSLSAAKAIVRRARDR